MQDLISRSALLELAHNNVGGTVDCNDIARFPAVDAEVVRHGRWIPVGHDDMDAGMFRCSECSDERYFCEEVYTSEEASKYCRFCSECGAKMDAEVEE